MSKATKTEEKGSEAFNDFRRFNTLNVRTKPIDMSSPEVAPKKKAAKKKKIYHFDP